MLGNLLTMAFGIFGIYILIKSFKSEEYRNAYSLIYTSVILYITGIVYSILNIAFKLQDINWILNTVILISLYFILYRSIEYIRIKYFLKKDN